MSQTKEIQRRIKAVGNTKKITKAMEMVAAAKMRKSVDAVIKTRSYANLSWLTVLTLSQTINAKDGDIHPLLKKRDTIKNIAIVLITSNRGLCGSFNTNIINKTIKSIKLHQENQVPTINTDFILLGKKGAYVSKFGYNIEAQFDKNDAKVSVSDMTPITNMIIKGYLEYKYDKVMVAYTDFVSPSKQLSHVKQILPIEVNESTVGIMGKDTRLHVDKEMLEEKESRYLVDKNFNYEYTFEPDPYTVLDMMIPRLIEVQLYQALLESNASEHSMRMQTMHQATDSAKNMISELTLYYNKVRQSSITSEIAEISAGAESMR